MKWAISVLKTQIICPHVLSHHGCKWPYQFIFDDFARHIQMCLYEFVWFPQGSDKTVQDARHCHGRRKRFYRNLHGNAWLASCRHSVQQVLRAEAEWVWILPEQLYQWFEDSRVQANPINVKYINDADVNYLLEALTAVNSYWKGHKFCGLTMNWDYEKCEVHLSMPGYVQKALKRFKHDKPDKPQFQLYPHNPKTIRCKNSVRWAGGHVPSTRWHR